MNTNFCILFTFKSKCKGIFPNIPISFQMLAEHVVQSHTEIKAPPADPSNHRLFWQLLSDQSLQDRCLRCSDSLLCITAVSLDWCVYIMSSIDMVISEKAYKQGSEEIGWMKSPSFLSIPPPSTIFLSLPSLCGKLIKLVGPWKTSSELWWTQVKGECSQFWSFTLPHVFPQNNSLPIFHETRLIKPNNVIWLQKPTLLYFSNYSLLWA